MQSSGPPVLGLVLVGAVLVTAVLLLVGLGVAVGAGLLVGVLLGLTAVGTAMVATRRTSPAGWSVLSRKDEDATPGLLQEFGHAIARVADVDSGTLTSVIPIGGESTANGVRVEAIAAELRTDGGIVSLVTHTRPPIASPGHFAEVHLTDNAGTEYVAAIQGSGGSSPSTARYELRFSPAPPQEATELTIQITRFMDPFPETPNEPVDGPWSFTVPLPPHTPSLEGVR
jgi:hypothetical protein